MEDLRNLTLNEISTPKAINYIELKNYKAVKGVSVSYIS